MRGGHARNHSSQAGNGAGDAARPGCMDMTILIAAAVGTTLPCIALWVADQRAPASRQAHLSRRATLSSLAAEAPM